MTKKQKRLLVRIIISVILFAVVFAVEHFTSLDGYALLVAYLVPYFISGYDVLLKSAGNILHGRVFDEMFLMAVATVGAIIIGEYPESVFVMVFFQVGELFESIAVGKSRRSIAELMDIRPETACVIKNGVETAVTPEEVAVGDILIVRAGEKLPVDGVVTDGECSVDTSSLTGESVPVEIKKGDTVFGGSIDINGTVKIRAEKEYASSTVAKILELVENSSLNKAKSEVFLTRFARIYTPAVVCAAAVLALVPSLITGDWQDWVHRALIFLVVSCPCALVISVPLSFFGGIGGASASGILIKGANYLEALGKADTVVFDKTGTLTKGVFSVTGCYPEPDFDSEALLRLSACAEYYSNHPIARSLFNACGEKITPPLKTTEYAGLGVEAESENGVILVGNSGLLKKFNISFHEGEHNGTAVYVALNDSFVGIITIGDIIKETTEAALKELKDLGIKKLVMLTGDNEKSARSIGGTLGIDDIRAGLLPQDKVAEIEKLCAASDKKSAVVFVGDGINDAPVLTRADVGIAMGVLGSDAAIEAADGVIMDDDLLKLSKAVAISRKTKRIVVENIIFALGVKLGVLAFAAFGLTNMWVGVLADVGVAMIAILNAMRTLKRR